LSRTCRLCCGLVVDLLRGNWCNGFWPLTSTNEEEKEQQQQNKFE